jgi:hypothetical protein
MASDRAVRVALLGAGERGQLSWSKTGTSAG